jgi:hypothetical protein
MYFRPKAAAEVVQCCKNCLLVIFIVFSLQTLNAMIRCSAATTGGLVEFFGKTVY